MKRKTTEYAHECGGGHWSWSIEDRLHACPHMVPSSTGKTSKPCPHPPVLKGHKRITVEAD